MADAHRKNVWVTSCLKTPVDPHTKAPLASYERERALPYAATGHVDNRDLEKEVKEKQKITFLTLELNQSFKTTLYLEAAGDHLDLSEIFFSNEEYYSKLEELRKAHLHTMAELENMYWRKLQLKSSDPLDRTPLDVGSLSF
uniref:Uncharacterized protein n=1 Tax=Mastacembelus armatus TaxID=205130 RepID=A0A3Q3T185_9TELE